MHPTKLNHCQFNSSQVTTIERVRFLKQANQIDLQFHSVKSIILCVLEGHRKFCFQYGTVWIVKVFLATLN